MKTIVLVMIDISIDNNGNQTRIMVDIVLAPVIALASISTHYRYKLCFNVLTDLFFYYHWGRHMHKRIQIYTCVCMYIYECL